MAAFVQTSVPSGENAVIAEFVGETILKNAVPCCPNSGRDSAKTAAESFKTRTNVLVMILSLIVAAHGMESSR